MTYYLAIEAQQEPADLGELDDNGRLVYVFNVVSLSRPTATFLRELVKILEDAGVGVEASTIFAGSLSAVPSGAGPFLYLRSTSGVAPIGTHNAGAGAYRRPAAQVFVHGADADAVEAMAQAAHGAFLAVRNQERTA